VVPLVAERLHTLVEFRLDEAGNAVDDRVDPARRRDQPAGDDMTVLLPIDLQPQRFACRRVAQQGKDIVMHDD